jgi:hypothetical protein
MVVLITAKVGVKYDTCCDTSSHKASSSALP